MTAKPLDTLTLEEEKEFIDELNDSMNHFLVVAPNVEMGDTTDGHFIKMRTMPHDEYFSVGELIFELQHMLYIHKKRYPQLEECKLIISDLQLTKILPNTAFRRGLMVKIKYQFKELESKQRFIEGIYIEEAWISLPDYPEPPDDPRVPTTESYNQWEAYRKALREFSDKHKTK